MPRRRWRFSYFILLLLVILLPLHDGRPLSAKAEYDHAMELFRQGYLESSQNEAELGHQRFNNSQPDWAYKFLLLEAKSMLFRGMYSDALQLLGTNASSPNDPEEHIASLVIEAVSLIRQDHSIEGQTKLAEGNDLCARIDIAQCGDVMAAEAILADKQGRQSASRELFLRSFYFARSHRDRWSEAAAALNLGYASMSASFYDEAVHWTSKALQDARALGAKDTAQVASGNLGWAYLQLGDFERALEQFLAAEQSAADLGDIRYELKWITAVGYVYRDTDDLTRATQSYRQAFDLAKQLDSKEDIVNALEDLAQVSVDSGKLEDAKSSLDQVTPMELTGEHRLSANVLLTQGMLAAARREDAEAEQLFRQVQADTTSPTTTRLTAGYQLARLYETEGNAQSAEKIYKATLNDFDAAQAKLKSEESKLPFVANAARIYDDYIQLLVRQGRNEEALALADQSRARTLAQALGAGESKNGRALKDPRQIAAKTGATLLFYWLGQKQSYVWAITPAKVDLFPLPPERAIREQVESYNKFIQNLHNPLSSGNADGQALYRMLVAPAASKLHRDGSVTILADGALSALNFETLLAPGAGRELGEQADGGASVHYFLEDATILSAPSLTMLAAAKPVRDADHRLLLLGNPVSASDDFPSLPLFGFEMKRIEKHFSAQHVWAFDGARATPEAYLSSKPAQYGYIHFVSHAVASRTDPLDSAIILSDAKGGEDSFKLYARDIMQHPIDARLVTISACYGSGTRSYAGEGLVGLSWAFLRAGAHSVIGALWEVSDDSTPQLMDTLYGGLEKGATPAVALREAKLALIHTQQRFRVPFYWAPFQIYSAR